MGRTSSSGVEIRENSIRVIFSFRGKQCKETLYLEGAPMAPTPPNIKYAGRLVAEIKAKITTGDFLYGAYFPDSPRAKRADAGSNMLYDVMDRWHSLLNLKSSTMNQYKRRLEHFWKVQLPNRPIDQTRYSDILEALSNGTWASGKSRNNELAMIRGMFEFAKRDGLIKENPCDNVERASWQRPPPDPFSLKEVHVILTFLEQQYHEQVRNFTQFMFFTGLRTNEGIGLRWADVDLINREIKVEGGIVYDEETVSTKTHTARKVRLNSAAYEALTRQKAFTYLADEYVFHDPKTNAKWAYQKITDSRSYWARTLRLTGLRYRRPYNTRHTCATIGLMAGANPAYLAKQLGHSLKTFFDIYADWINGADNDREMQKIEASLAGNIPELSPKTTKAEGT